MNEDSRNDERDARALAAATRVVTSRGLSALTRDSIADEAGLSPASVSNFGRSRLTNGNHDSEGYRSRILRAMMVKAIETGDIALVRIGLADGCLKALDVPIELAGAAGL